MVVKPNQTDPNLWFGLVTKSVLVKTGYFCTSGSVSVKTGSKPVYNKKNPFIYLISFTTVFY